MNHKFLNIKLKADVKSVEDLSYANMINTEADAKNAMLIVNVSKMSWLCLFYLCRSESKSAQINITTSNKDCNSNKYQLNKTTKLKKNCFIIIFVFVILCDFNYFLITSKLLGISRIRLIFKATVVSWTFHSSWSTVVDVLSTSSSKK